MLGIMNVTQTNLHYSQSIKKSPKSSPNKTLDATLDVVDSELEELEEIALHMSPDTTLDSRPHHPLPKEAQTKRRRQKLLSSPEEEKDLSFSEYLAKHCPSPVQFTNSPPKVHKPSQVFRPGNIGLIHIGTTRLRSSSSSGESSASDSDDGFRSWNSSRAMTPLRVSSPTLEK